MAEAEDIDFKIEGEEWNVYELSDQTVLRIRPIILKFMKQRTAPPAGPTPVGIASQNVMVIRAKPELRGTPSFEFIDITKIPDSEKTEVSATPFNEPWNRYVLSDGRKVRLKLVVISVFRVKNKFDQFGQPLYIVKSDNLVSVE